MDEVTVNKNALAGLLKRGAAETQAVVKAYVETKGQRDVLLKFAKAVEILPALEKTAVLHFPEGLPFAEKAFRLAKKSSAELEKLAYMAEHLPDAVPEMAKVAEDKRYSGKTGVGELTQRLLAITG
jgi:hypothetical protein